MSEERIKSDKEWNVEPETLSAEELQQVAGGAAETSQKSFKESESK